MGNPVNESPHSEARLKEEKEELSHQLLQLCSKAAPTLPGQQVKQMNMDMTSPQLAYKHQETRQMPTLTVKERRRTRRVKAMPSHDATTAPTCT